MITQDPCLFRNLDYLETHQGDFWTVIGNEHPPDKVVAFIKYKRTGQNEDNNKAGWSKNNIYYERAIDFYSVSQIEKTFDSLAADYIFYDNHLGFNMSCVPHSKIKTHYIPSLGLKKIQSADPEELDPLQAKLLELVDYFSYSTKIPKEKFGITGSLLIGLQNPNFSDIDLIINGEQSSELRDFLKKGIHDNQFSPLNEDDLNHISKKKAEIFSIPIEQTKIFIQRRWNNGIFQKTRFSIHPVQKQAIYPYNDTNFEVIGETTLTAEIIDNKDALFYPCRWKITPINILESTKSVKSFGSNITELVSYEGFYLDVFEVGEKVEITGKVERVKTSNEDDHFRVIVGGIGKPSKILLSSLNP